MDRQNVFGNGDSLAQGFLSTLLGTIPIGIVVADPKGNLLYYNPAFASLTGYSEEELKSHTWKDLTPPEWHEHEESALEALRRTGEPQTYQKEYLRKDKTRVPVEIEVHKAADPESVYAFITDITGQKQMEEVMHQQAHQDSLTGLPNKEFFLEHLELELTRAQRDQRPRAVLFLDLDRFKEINDALGHTVGDQVVKKVARRIKSCIRKSDMIARIGGDEFTILLSNVAHAEDAAVIAKKILADLQKPLIMDLELRLTASIGMSMYPEDGEEAETLLKHADIAMHHAKGQGRNNYQFYDPTMNTRALERMILENSLKQTLARGELVVHYQPQYSLRERKVMGAEALVRWNHPELGLLNPMQFLPIAEETGFITSLDEWMLRAACEQNRVWHDAGLPNFCVTVNLSAQQFMQPHLASLVTQVLAETGLPPHSLELEIHESAAMRDMERALPSLHRLRDTGAQLAIDNFGSGCSSLGNLRDLPVQKLKIDRSFIRDIASDPVDKAIVGSLISIAHKLKMDVVAEGVETDEQLSFLYASGCDKAQGFLFGEPMLPETLKARMQHH